MWQEMFPGAFITASLFIYVDLARLNDKVEFVRQGEQGSTMVQNSAQFPRSDEVFQFSSGLVLMVVFTVPGWVSASDR